MDFDDLIPEGDFEIVVNMESWAENSNRPRRGLRLNVQVDMGKISRWTISDNGDTFAQNDGAAAVLARNFEFKPPPAWLYALPLESSDSSTPAATKIPLRFSVWQNKLPVDALPVEGWMELHLRPEEEFVAEP